MKLKIKTNGNCRSPETLSITLDGQPFPASCHEAVSAIDIRFRPDGVKVVVGGFKDFKTMLLETRTFYINGDSSLELEMGEVDEKSTISADM